MIQLDLTSPFWEDPAILSAAGEDHEAVIRICVEALLAAGYDVSVRDADGQTMTWDEYLEEEGDA